MGKTITAVRIRKDRAEILKEKAMNLTVKKKEYVMESDLINFLIDVYAERIDIDKDGLYIKEEEE